ncbi:MAG: hypothetical protein K8T90_16275 [Planctomycetes bacterium]|nr:hypothetical protein [Planctomycetota bacterium]
MDHGSDPFVREGECHAIFAFDIGREIDMEQATAALRIAPRQAEEALRRPHLHFAQPPLRTTVRIQSIAVGDTATRPDATLVVYEFGVVAVVITLPATGGLESLARLAIALWATEALAFAARHVAEETMRQLGDAVDEPTLATMSEDYLVFHARRVDSGATVTEWMHAASSGLAAILRAETGPLSAQEIERTVSGHVAFAPDDFVIVDGNAAFVVRDHADDLLALLTFATVQLLEVRFLDARLDDDLQRSYDVVRRVAPRSVLVPAPHRGALEQVARRQIDAALLFEHVRNAPKLLGDQYLARVYEQAARRFRLGDWNDAIHRKLDVLGTIYDRLRDRATVTRAEILEWIVIVLIVVSMVIPFLVPTTK